MHEIIKTKVCPTWNFQVQFQHECQCCGQTESKVNHWKYTVWFILYKDHTWFVTRGSQRSACWTWYAAFDEQISEFCSDNLVYFHHGNFLTFLPPFSDIFTLGSIFRHFYTPETKKSRIFNKFSDIFTCNRLFLPR